MPTLLWWGRSDPDYSRNRIIWDLLADLGWSVRLFHPFVSESGRLEAYLRRPQKPDCIWVPCFRHRDIASASHWADIWNVPLIIDPLISAFEKEAFERRKYDPLSDRGQKRRHWESLRFLMADIVVADTPAHGDYYRKTLEVRPDRLMTLYVGAETDLFRPMAFPSVAAPYQVLFFGSFIELQGAEVIVEAAKQTPDLDIVWTLLGEGDTKPDCMHRARGFDKIRFEPWIEYHRLPERISRAHLLFGIFGTTVKADRVIPNKLFQAMAVGRPVITRTAIAYAKTLAGSEIVGWVPGGDPSALAFLVRKWFESPSHLIERGAQTRKLFEAYFSKEKLKASLNSILETALHRGRRI